MTVRVGEKCLCGGFVTNMIEREVWRNSQIDKGPFLYLPKRNIFVSSIRISYGNWRIPDNGDNFSEKACTLVTTVNCLI